MNHTHYMQRAIELAKNGLGTVSPNPMVGCVIVYDNRIIGEGWHQKYGEAHAEVHATNSVVDKNLLKEATIYITLEPCTYHGKTPACSDLLISLGVKKVVVATLDPNPKVLGKGIIALKNAGITVEMGVLEKEAMALNQRFYINQKLNRPFVILKWAQTCDGFIARSNYDSKWISNEYSRQRVHQWRAEEDAVLVGKNTAKYDNPLLTVRDWQGNNPIRVVLDSQLELNTSLNLFNGDAQTLVYNTLKNKQEKNLELVKIDKKNFLIEVLENLYQKGLGSIIVEGGSKVLNSFITLNLWDEARVFTSEKSFGNGIKAPKMDEGGIKKEIIEDDELKYYYNPKTTQIWQKN